MKPFLQPSTPIGMLPGNQGPSSAPEKVDQSVLLVSKSWQSAQVAKWFGLTLLSGYPSNSAEYKALEAKRAAFLEMCPQVQTSSQQTTVRSTARPDFSIEGGKEPLDHTRMVDLAGIPAGDFTGERQGPNCFTQK